MLKKLLALAFVSGVLLTACTGNSTTGNGGNTPVVQSQVDVIIDPMSSVPVLNGTGTKGTLYIHNYTNQDVSGLRFNLNQAIFTSQIKTLIAKAGLNLGGGIEDKNGFVLLNSERCVQIAANSSCAINFVTPNLSFGNQGSALVNVTYISNNKPITNSQVVNYKYVDGSLSTGVNFTGNVDLSGTPGTTKYVVGYLYGGNLDGGVYKNVNLVSNNPTATISGGFINNQEVAPNQVIAVEYKIAIQSNQKSFIEIVPTWGNSVPNISRSNVNGGNGAPLVISIDPKQNTANYLFGNVPILKAATGESATIPVVNNGNGDGTAITAVKTGGETDGITINTSDCTANKLKANANGTCNIVYTVNTYTSGSTTVTYENGSGTVVGSQVIYWTNNKPAPAVSGIPTLSYVEINKESISNIIQFNFENIGNVPLESMKITPVVTGPVEWTVTESNCTTILGVGNSCYIKGVIKSNDDGVGIVYYTMTGNYGGNGYSFLSLPTRYIVEAAPQVVITPASVVNVTVLANNESLTTNTYIAKNIGNDPALVTDISLSAMTNLHKPVISESGTCDSIMTLGINESCSIVVNYGPEASDIAINESGSTHIVIDYHGGTPDTVYQTKSESYNYSLVGNDTYLQESIVATGFESGTGTVDNPYKATALDADGEIKVTYTNPSTNYPLSNFNLNINDLPYGMKIVSSTCPTESAVTQLAIGANCEIIFGLDKELLKTSPQGGSTVFDFTLPTGTWTTPLGFYKQVGSSIDISYLQPSVSFSLSINNGTFESTALTMRLTNASSGASPFVVDVSEVKRWLESSPVALTNNCTVDVDYGVSCSLSGNSTESVGEISYIMPTHLQQNESTMIPLFYSTSNFGYLSSTYSFITYIILPPPPVIFTHVSTNGSFSCALSDESKSYCWGYGANGQIGNGANSNVNMPTLVNMPSGVSFTSISTNGSFSCALGDNSKAYCWGYGYFGQIGNGATSTVNIPTEVNMPIGVSFTSISTNGSFSCALGDNGKAYCWGYGSFGQIGNAATSNVNIPTEVNMPIGVSFTSISTNGSFSCALGDNGKAYCWGYGGEGQIGNGATSNVNIPTEVNMPIGVAFTSISTNDNFSCALGDNGKAYCWGLGSNGQIGNGATSNVNIPTEVNMPIGVSFTSISTNGNFSCALGDNSEAYCWGAGSNGQIGNGANSSVNIPTEVSMPSGVAFTSISTNGSFSCALGDNGKAYCWGAGSNGQIGNGANSNVNVPTEVTMPYKL